MSFSDAHDIVNTEHKDVIKQIASEGVKYFDLHLDRVDVMRIWPRASVRELRERDRAISRHRQSQRI